MRGCIRKREGKRGTTWQVIVDGPRDANGKRQQKWVTVKTKKEADALAAQMTVAVENGTFLEADAKKLTVNEYLTQWLEMKAQSLKPSAHRRYRENIDSHVRPFLGKTKLAKLSGLHIQSFYADRLKAGYSPSTVNLLHNILHGAMKGAVRLRLIATNPTEMVDPPRPNNPEMQAWNAQQASAFLAVADQHEWTALWRLAITTGARRGELLGLKWEDIDWAQNALSIRRTLSRGEKGGFEFGTPKTQKGKRKVELTASVIAILQVHRRKQLETRLARGTAYQDQGLVFANPIGQPLHPNTVRNQFLKLVAQAGVPAIRIHDIRHTHATLMLANGENPKVVSERLGHANIGITLDRYSHVTPTMQREAANRLDKLLEGAS